MTAAKDRSTGAVVAFVGVVRDDGIEGIELEAYHDVAVQFMERIGKVATECFGLHAVTIVRRNGPLCVDDNILIIAASAGHRKEALAATSTFSSGSRSPCRSGRRRYPRRDHGG